MPSSEIVFAPISLVTVRSPDAKERTAAGLFVIIVSGTQSPASWARTSCTGCMHNPPAGSDG